MHILLLICGTFVIASDAAMAHVGRSFYSTKLHNQTKPVSLLRFAKAETNQEIKDEWIREGGFFLCLNKKRDLDALVWIKKQQVNKKKQVEESKGT